MSKEYEVLVVDPPWSYGKPTIERKISRNVSSRHYKTIGASGDGEINRHTGEGIENIINSFPVGEYAASNAHLYLWATNPKLPFAFRVMQEWGFIYKTTLTWIKVRKDGGIIGNGMGWFYRGATEHVLFGVKGRKPIPSELRKPNVFLAKRGKHSEKPQEFYDLVDKVSGEDAKKIDVFARKVRSGWDAWGDEFQQCKGDG